MNPFTSPKVPEGWRLMRADEVWAAHTPKLRNTEASCSCDYCGGTRFQNRQCYSCGAPQRRTSLKLSQEVISKTYFWASQLYSAYAPPTP